METPETFRKEWTLAKQIGGDQLIHARGCDLTKAWDSSGMREVFSFEPNDPLCKCCEKLTYITLGAKDYPKQYENYKKQLIFVPIATLKLLFKKNHATCFYRPDSVMGDKMYIHCREDDWYIDFSDDDIKLYHNNYSVRARERGERSFMEPGYHLEKLKSDKNVGKINEALLKIARYNFEAATEIHHTQNTKKKPSITMEDLEKWYGDDNPEDDPYIDPSYYGFHC